MSSTRVKRVRKPKLSAAQAPQVRVAESSKRAANVGLLRRVIPRREAIVVGRFIKGATYGEVKHQIVSGINLHKIGVEIQRLNQVPFFITLKNFDFTISPSIFE